MPARGHLGCNPSNRKPDRGCAPIGLLPIASRLWLCAAVGLVLGLPFCSTQAQVRVSEDSRVKAAYLYNFAKFVEWPANTFRSADDPTLICAIGDDRIGEVLLDTVTGKKANGRPVEARRLTSLQDIRSCQILFIGFADKEHISEILEQLRDVKALTVGQTEQFIALGGMINLVQQNDRIELEIDPQAADAAGLKISSRLLVVSRVVTGRAHGGGQ